MHDTFHPDNPDILWVHADAPDVGCTGTFENPFSTPEIALTRVKPGQTIVLMDGEYVGDCNFQVSGTIRNPIRICAQHDAKAIIRSACWFFYDTSDFIVSGLTFADAPFGAISLIGACNRNRLENIRFVNCSTRGATACTLYMGGSGGGCNVVEGCVFEGRAIQPAPSEPATISVGLLLAQGDPDSGEPIVNNVIRKNRFSGYAYGILVGSDETKVVRCGHIIEYNTINDCVREGILVKCGDTTVRGNILHSCRGTAITVRSDLDCGIESNRIVNSSIGMQIHGRGHSIVNNCLVNCSEGAIWIRGATEADTFPAVNCFIERNTLVNCASAVSGDEEAVCGILIDSGTTGILQQNLIVGCGRPYAVIHPPHGEEPTVDTRFIIKDNVVSGECTPAEGAGYDEIVFADAAHDDYSTRHGSGASGWVVTPMGFDPSIDDYDGDSDYRDAAIREDEQGNLLIPGENDLENPLGDFFGEGSADKPFGDSENSYWFPNDDD